MFSKEESTKLIKEFWLSFGKSFPRKWLLYHTKIKGFAFKFVATKKIALVCLDIEMKNEELKYHYYDKLLSLKNILIRDFINEAIFDSDYILDNGKSISRVYIKLQKKFSIHNKNSWQDAYAFFIFYLSQFIHFN